MKPIGSPATDLALRNQSRSLFYSCLPSIEIHASGNPAKWARDKRWIAAGESPLSQDGRVKFSFDNAPWCEEPCEQVTNPENQEVILQWASGMGKTLGVFLNVFGWIVDEAPRHVLWALKTKDQMEEISKKQINPAIMANPSLLSRISPAKSRDSSNTITNKLFPGGSISMIGTESIVGFRANRSPCVIGDEIDSWNGEVGGEGDPVSLLYRRSDGFNNSIRLLGSTPGTKGRSRIEKKMLLSDYRKWFVPCRKCGASTVIMFADIWWPDDRWSEAVWLCSACKTPHNDRQRRESVMAGEWKPTQPFRGIRGYWLNGFPSLMPPNTGYEHRMHQWAKDVTDASRSENAKEAKKVIVQTLFAETWQEEEDAKPDWMPLMERREDYKLINVPKGVIRVTVGVDVQEDRLEAEIVGHGRGEETWGIRYLVVRGDTTQPAVWNALEAALSIEIKREDGKILPIAAVGVDTSAPKPQQMAYDFIRPRQPKRWFAFKGSSQVDFPAAGKSAKSKVTRVSLIIVGTNRIKGWIYDRALNATPGTAGYMHFSTEYAEPFFAMLFSETSTPVWKNNVRYRQFTCPNGVRNEGLDCRVYAMASLYSLGPCNWDYEEKQLKDASMPTVEPAKPAVRKSGFVGASSWSM